MKKIITLTLTFFIVVAVLLLPNAVAPASDGDWVKINDEFYTPINIGGQTVLLKENAAILIWDGVNLQESNTENKSVLLENLNGEVKVELQSTVFSGKNIIAPKSTQYLPCDFSWSADGTKLYLSTETGLWEAKVGNDGVVTTTKLSGNVYDGKSINQLNEDYAQRTNGQGTLYWNALMQLNPNGDKIAYVSNKDSYKIGGQSLFVLDLTNHQEDILKSSQGEAYITKGWLNSEYILCEEYTEGGSYFDAVRTDGTSILLDLEGSAPYILDVKNNYVAYSTEGMGGNRIKIQKFDGTDGLQDIQSISIQGSSAAEGKFSDDCRLFGCIYAPGATSYEQYVKVIELDTGNAILVNDLPHKENNNVVFVRNFEFNSTGNLILNIGELSGKIILDSTWTYLLR